MHFTVVKVYEEWNGGCLILPFFFENASMGIITQGIEKITCRWDSTLNMVKYNHNMRSEVYSMKKLFKVFSLMLVVIMAFPFSVMASENDQQRSDLIGAEERILKN